MFRLYLMLIIIAVVGGVLFGAWYEYKDMQERIKTLQENNAKLEIVAAENQKTVENLQQFAADMAAQNQQLSSDLQKAEAYKDGLLAKLQKHDLALLSLKKPGLIEKRINSATKKVFDDIEALTGVVVEPTN